MALTLSWSTAWVWQPPAVVGAPHTTLAVTWGGDWSEPEVVFAVAGLVGLAPEAARTISVKRLGWTCMMVVAVPSSNGRVAKADRCTQAGSSGYGEAG